MRDRPKKTKKPAGAGLPPLAPEAAARLRGQVSQVLQALETAADLETLRGLITTSPEDPLWDSHLLHELAQVRHEAIPPLLAALFGSSPDKERRKALKRALHLLQTRGVPVGADLLPREAGPLGKGGASACLALVSPIFGTGQRYVILEGPTEILGGNFLVTQFSDQEGIRECLLLSLKRKHRQEFWDHFRQQGIGECATVPAAYAVNLLEEAWEKNPQAETGAQRYRALKDRIRQYWGRAEEAPALAQLLPALTEAERNLYLEQSRELATKELFQSWLPGVDEVAPWLNKLQEVQESPLVLSEPQRQMRLEGVMDEAAAAFFPPETRGLWSRRLLEMAYFLDLKGRQEEARAAQAAGEDLATGATGALRGENPFLQDLTRYALRLGWELFQDTQKQAQASSLVTPASEPLLIRR
ncbi:MAG: hypothetical protein A2Y80_08190 [Deltaproteobacteria bacterium RBG_13_58_19]|nr:MAG: hypothetical protein A2Y80_08190 [Deltaproteobacteria bacterium RBG_13_58_19]